MKLERIIEILEKHQEWRRDKNVPPKKEMQSPIEIGTAIDYAIIELKKQYEQTKKRLEELEQELGIEKPIKLEGDQEWVKAFNSLGDVLESK